MRGGFKKTKIEKVGEYIEVKMHSNHHEVVLHGLIYYKMVTVQPRTLHYAAKSLRKHSN